MSMQQSTPSPLAPLAVLLEKVFSTYVQVFVSLLIVGSVINVSTVQSAAMAGIPTALTLIANGLPAVPVGLPFYVDLLLRVVRTYVVSFVGLVVAQPAFHLNRSIAQAALVGALPAALSALKGGIASKVGRADSAALLPVALDVPVSAVA